MFSEQIFLGKNIRNFLGNNFEGWGHKVQCFISGNIRKAFFWENITKAFFWENIRKAFLWENIRTFLILGRIIIFFVLRLGSVLGSCLL